MYSDKQKQNWVLKKIIKPKFSSKWMKSHHAVPTAYKLRGDIFRVFFCTRDKFNHSQLIFLDYDVIKEKIYSYSPKTPALKTGKLGSFDQNGITPSWLIKNKSKYLLYYVGWNKSFNVRMKLFTGLAESKNLNKFKKYSLTPILERNNIDPYLTATNCVLKEKKKFKMWYVSGEKWFKHKKEIYPRYNIKYAESNDGIHWKREGKISLNFKSKTEYALARPSVLKFKNLYHMWYSYKTLNSEYRIGYAISKNGIDFKRRDNLVNLNILKGFNDQMSAYPYIFFHKKKLYMFLNGNGYGKSGIGLSILK